MSSRAELLLYVLSAWGTLSWERYKRLFDELWASRGPTQSLEHIRFARNDTVRVLSSLGHVDFSFARGNSRVWVTSPALTPVPFGGDPVFILSGSRSPVTKSAIVAAAARVAPDCIVSDEPANGLLIEAPNRMCLSAASTTSVRRLAHELRIDFHERPAALALGELALDIDDYLTRLSWTESADLALPEVSFDAEFLRMQRERRIYSGMRFSSYDDSRMGRALDIIWSGTRRADVDRDWARWAVLREAGRAPVVYDPREYLLGVPLAAPLPTLLARAAVMCSGFSATVLASSAQRPREDRILAYQLVPENIARLISSKLGQRLASRSVADW